MELLSILEELSVLEATLVILFMVSVMVQLVYYLAIFSKLAYYKSKPDTTSFEPVSVIVSAHDEDYNLRKNLPAILNQDYPDYEVVVVNHASTDDTKELLEDFQRQHSNLKIVTIQEDLNFFKGKKFPLSIGIKSAKNDLLLLTDADCKPVSELWIRNIAQNYNAGAEVVLGYGPYEKSGGLLNMIIRYDTLLIAMQYFSFALIGKPYMGVGRNLSYRKSLFIKNKGFTSHYNISSGDDDLFIMQVANKSNTRIEINPNSFMVSAPKTTFRNWFYQKRRHLTTGKEYSVLFKFLLGLHSTTQILFYIALIALIINNILLIPVVVSAIILIGVKALIQKKVADRLGENQLLLFSLFGDIVYTIIMTTLSITGIFRKQGDWK